jgi:hypothetical protein
MARWTSALSFLALVWCVVPDAGLAQPHLGMSELARAKSMLDLYRTQLSAEQYALLSSRLAQTEQAYVELTTLTEAGGEAAAVAAESGVAAEAATTGVRTLLGSAAEVLPLLLFVWPSTAQAPTLKEEKPEVRAARLKLEQRVEELTQAVRQVEEERGAASAPKSTDSVDTGCGSSQSPEQDDEQAKCTGQEHHIISKTVWKELQYRPMLKHQYRYRDPRFVAKAKDLKAHCGYQDWHRKLDHEIAKWIKEQQKLTPEQFDAYLREVYRRPDLRARFPNGF